VWPEIYSALAGALFLLGEQALMADAMYGYVAGVPVHVFVGVGVVCVWLEV
jgi:hypothetical protein